MSISYEGQDGATGDYATDVMTIAGAAVTTMQLAIAYKSTVTDSVLGVGYPSIEAQADDGTAYDNLPQLLYKQGKIASAAYSLWLNSFEGTNGQLLFGGVDTEKFYGNLVKFPLQPSSSSATTVTEFFIKMAGVGLTKNGKSAVTLTGGAAGANILLDSGTLLTYLESSLAKAIFTQVGATYDSSEGVAYIPCTSQTSLTTIDFKFAGLTISVPMSQMVISNPPDSDDDQCLFGVAIGNDPTSYILGDTFLSTAYIVYDLTNYQVYMAKTDFNATKSNIVPIAAGTAGVPTHTGVALSATAPTCSATTKAVTGTYTTNVTKVASVKTIVSTIYTTTASTYTSVKTSTVSCSATST
jgi:Eukaryotic aspartyl protease